ncbi:MAG: helix-turn-helix transcriptional regulator, partial [Pygmaiobacter sp.]
MFQINLKKLRERNGWSQVELAHRLGVSQSTVGMWEAGRNKPTYATLLKIAQEFKVSVDGLIGGVWNGSLAFSGNPPMLASQAVVYATEAPV